MRWLEITIEATTSSADAAAEILMSEGCGGTAYSLPDRPDSDDCVDVTGYLPVNDGMEPVLGRVKDRTARLPEQGLPLRSDQIRVRWVQDDDWASAWRKYFKPLRVGRVVIKPSWEDFSPEPGDVVVELDPGMAFGTGMHESTRLCLLALQEHVRGGIVVLDVGTGSGILAIAAAMLGASKVYAIDNDPVAVEAASKNAARTGLKNTISVSLADSPAAIGTAADVTVANIIPNVIIPMARALCSATKPGGMVITSGIVTERSSEVIEALESAGLVTVGVRTEGDWVALESRRPA